MEDTKMNSDRGEVSEKSKYLASKTFILKYIKVKGIMTIPSV